MSTGSTKSSARNSGSSSGRSRIRAIEERGVGVAGLGRPEETHSAPDMETGTWRLMSLLVLLLAASVRLYALELNPLHHDEGVNGFFLINLVNNGVYRYDPANYHGPTLYYFTLLVAKFIKLFGAALSTFTIRLVPVMFGVGSVWLILCLRRRLGSIGALTGAALLALSPGAVYMSRYFIHESLFVFFTLGLVVAAIRYYDTANPFYLMLAASTAALLFATKETAMISAGVLLIALATSALYVRLRNGPTTETRNHARARSTKPQRRNPPLDRGSEPLARFDGPTGIAVWSLAALVVFIFVYVLFYSSFFTQTGGVSDSLKTFEIWAKTGKRDHVHVWYTYLSWLWGEEAPLLCLGASGIIMSAIFRPRARFHVFAALWAFGIVAAYSLIPYKTPWLVLNFIVPLTIIAGWGVDALYRRAANDRELRALVLALLSVALIICSYQMIQLNFRHYDDEQYIYPYAHTVREMLPLVDRINSFAKRTGTGNQTTISITSPDYWPLPWYLRDYRRVGYAGRIAVADEHLVIAAESQEAELETLLGDRYRRIDSYTLRPGVTLILYGRRDLVEGHD